MHLLTHDPLFGPGLRPASPRGGGGHPAGLRRLCSVIATTAGLGWRADRAALMAVFTGQLVMGAATAIGYLVVRNLLATMLAAGSAHERIVAVAPTIALLAGATAVRGLCDVATIVASGRLGPRVARLAQTELLELAVRLELVVIEDPTFHDSLAAARRGAEATRRGAERVAGLVGGAISIASALSILILMSPLLLPLLLLALLPKAWGVARTAGARHASARSWMTLTRQLDELAALMTHRHSAEELRAHRLGRFLLHHHGRLADQAEREQMRLVRQEAATRLFVGFGTGAASFLTYACLGLLVFSGRIPLALAGAAALAFRSSSMTMASLTMQMQQLYEDGLFILDWRQMRQKPSPVIQAGTPLPEVSTAITAEALRFTYPGSRRPALIDIDVNIAQGQVVAFVGENGSGKSTLAKLLTGLYLPTDGSVRWDGVSTDQLDRNALFDRVSLVSQDFVQWPFTARMNVAVGRADGDLDQERLGQAAAAAGADVVVEALHLGWDTLLAREFYGGTQLSGGQWQRLALARAWYRDAQVLLVDEPTSALDPATEIAVFGRLMELAKRGRTVILVTHRLASVARADQIFVLAGGRIVEHGSHADLMRGNGPYATTYRLQAAQYEQNGKGCTSDSSLFSPG